MRNFSFKLFPILQKYLFIMFGVIFLSVIALSPILMESIIVVFDDVSKI